MAGKVIHGMNAVREALATGRIVNRVYFAKESRARGYKQLLERAKADAIPIDFVPQAKLNDLTGTREHQGVAAAISPIEYATLESCIAQCPQQATLLICDQIQHARNLGLLIRTAAGAGASGVLLSARKGALLDETVIRASAGTVFRIPVISCAKLSEAIRQLKENDFWVFGLDAGATASVFEMDWPDRCAIIVGNETSGLSTTVRKQCDEQLQIPLANDLDSLNAAVATGIALFQIVGQRDRKGTPATE